jgi:hypothetical protein
LSVLAVTLVGMPTKPVAPDPGERFDALVDELVGTAGVSPPRPGRGFGSSAIRVQNKIFAMLVRGRLVVKLPRARVDALVGAGDGSRFDANKGTPMKEWLSLHPESTTAWLVLAREALEFVDPSHRSR